MTDVREHFRKTEQDPAWSGGYRKMAVKSGPPKKLWQRPDFCKAKHSQDGGWW